MSNVFMLGSTYVHAGMYLFLRGSDLSDPRFSVDVMHLSDQWQVYVRLLPSLQPVLPCGCTQLP